MVEEYVRASEEDATYIPVKPEWGETRENSPARALLFNSRHSQGVANAEEHMRRMLSSRDLAGCPCLACTGRFR